MGAPLREKPSRFFSTCVSNHFARSEWMVEAGLYRDLLIAISGGVTGALLSFFGQLIIQRYRAYLESVSQLRSEVYIPLYNEVSSIKDGSFPSPPRTEWQLVSPHLKLKVDDKLREELDNYHIKYNRLSFVRNKLIGKGGVFEERLPEDMQTHSANGELTLKLEGDFDLPNHSIAAKTLLRNFEEELFDAENPGELRENIMRAYDEDIVYKLNAVNNEWEDIFLDCLKSHPAQRWKELRDGIREDAKSLEPKLRGKVTGLREKIRI